MAQFDADIAAAVAIAKRRGVTLKSFVFPRNQYSDGHLGVLGRNGFKVFVLRGNERAWAYRATAGAGQSKTRRALRLADHYLNVTGQHVHGRLDRAGLVETPASRFLRSYSRSLAALDRLRLHRITSALAAAAAAGRSFHLWWHPHNFGVNIEQKVEFLTHILAQFAKHKDRHRMVSANRGDFA